MLRKSLRGIVTVLLTAVVLLSLVACSREPIGTYTAKEGLVRESFTFKENNKVDMTAFGIDIEGDYVIEEGNITITYTVLGLSYDWTKSFSMDGDSIFIDGEEFVLETEK